MNKKFLFPGQYLVTDQPTLISTVLGSCVGVAIYDKVNRVAALCHYLLADAKPPPATTARYGSYAIPQMLDEMLQIGAKREHLEAQILGGGSVVRSLTEIGGGVGARNLELAKQILKAEKIAVVKEDVGGKQGRKIYFDTKTFSIESNLIDASETVSTSNTTLEHVDKVVRVLIVDDSATARTVFEKTLSASPNIKVVGKAVDPFDARQKIVKLKPDVLTLDIEMPRMNGVEFLSKLMVHFPLPVIMVSSLGSNGKAAKRALKLGAVEFVHKPSQFDPDALRELGETLIPKVLAAANVNVTKINEERANDLYQSITTKNRICRSSQIDAICVGGNTGANQSVEKLLAGLANDSPPTILAISSITQVVDEFISLIRPKANISIKIVEDSEFLREGYVYVPAPGKHAKLERENQKVLVKAVDGPLVFSNRPSCNTLFESAQTVFNNSFVGILLSGFGSDGVSALLKLRESGGITIVENPQSSPCSIMPANAVELGAAEHIVESSEIGDLLLNIRNKNAA